MSDTQKDITTITHRKGTRGSMYVRKTNRKFKFPTGRPSNYKPEFCKTIIETMSKGDSFTYWCSMQGILREQAHEWMRAHPEFLDAYKIAKANCESVYDTILNEKLRNNEKLHNEGLYKYYMNIRFGLRETVQTQNQNLNVNADVDIERVRALSDEIELKEY